MESQRRTKTPYSYEGLRRALAHHQQRGVVRSWTMPGSSAGRWRIGLAGAADVQEFTDPQVYALVVGLAAAERPVVQLREQLDTLTEALGAVQEALGDQASHFTCAEAEWIAKAYRITGHDGWAAEFVAAHGQSDLPGDEHYKGLDAPLAMAAVDGEAVGS